MPFTLPNIESGPSFAGQAAMDATDIAILTAALDGTGVLTGCTVSQHTGSDMKVDVAAGTVQIAGTQYSVPSATGHLAASAYRIA